MNPGGSQESARECVYIGPKEESELSHEKECSRPYRERDV